MAKTKQVVKDLRKKKHADLEKHLADLKNKRSSYYVEAPENEKNTKFKKGLRKEIARTMTILRENKLDAKDETSKQNKGDA